MTLPIRYVVCLNNYQELSDEVLYQQLSQEASEILEVKLWAFQI